ncbi:MAG TPA: right-handed parallel beta-helix repeat-containing protein [Micromonosporaceae bacterium]
MGRPTRALVLAIPTVVAALALAPASASAHDERPPVYPDGSGHVPAYRPDGPTLLVCKTDAADFATRVAGFAADLKARNLALFDQCQRGGYHNLQEAVNNVQQPGMNILVLPGVYREEPSLASPSGNCASLPAPMSRNGLYQVLSWEDQVACPNNQNLVAVLNKKDLQIEGTGAAASDVIVDAQYERLNAIRADRSNGFYIRNMTVQRTTFNAMYIMETDGFVIDNVVGRWNDEYGFLTFADDHGLYTDCEGYGNGDSGIYPGAASDINHNQGHRVDRYAIEIRRCYSHDNLLGYSGTAGDSVWAHDNVFTHNSAGVATDSAFPNHPGMPQNHAKFERNVIGDNNEDYYGYVRDGTCAKPYAQRGYEHGVVCPSVGLPAGTGVLNPGGNYNIWRDNWIYGHRYAGFVTSWVPGFVRGDNGFAQQFDTSNHNRYLANKLGVSPDGRSFPNRMDFWWDGQGRGSCWQAPVAGSEPYVLPACGADELPAGLGINRFVAEPAKTLKLYVCNGFSQPDRRIPANCDWFGATGVQRVEVQSALGEAVLLGVLLLGLWARRLRRSGPALVSLLIAVGGLVVGVFGTAYEASPLTPIGLALLGLGAAGFGYALRGRGGRPGLGWLTVALGVFALLGAVDRGLVMIPLIPVPPSLVRILIEVVWVPWAFVVLVRRGRPSLAPPPAEEAAAAQTHAEADAEPAAA